MIWTMAVMAAVQAATPAACPPRPPIGRAVTLRRDAVLPVVPAKAAPKGSFAGTVPLPVGAAGTYRVSVSEGVWIDVVRDGRAETSTAHGHGERCSGVAKSVEFALQPGDYVIELSGAKTAALSVEIARR